VNLTSSWINLGIIGTAALIPFLTGVLADAFRDEDLLDQKAAVVLYTLIAALISAAWLPVFLYLYRHPQLMKPHLPATIFASQVLGLATWVLLYVVAAALGGFSHQILPVGIFVLLSATMPGPAQGKGRRLQSGSNAGSGVLRLT
jgi:hypothetical protein